MLLGSFFVKEPKYLIIEKDYCTTRAAFLPHASVLSVTATVGEILQLSYPRVTRARNGWPAVTPGQPWVTVAGGVLSLFSSHLCAQIYLGRLGYRCCFFTCGSHLAFPCLEPPPLTWFCPWGRSNTLLCLLWIWNKSKCSWHLKGVYIVFSVQCASLCLYAHSNVYHSLTRVLSPDSCMTCVSRALSNSVFQPADHSPCVLLGAEQAQSMVSSLFLCLLLGMFSHNVSVIGNNLLSSSSVT